MDHPRQPQRRLVLQASAAVTALGLLPTALSQSRPSLWPAWDSFRSQFISPDGRVISDDGDGLQTYSEGQSYALFFALVANDRPTFDRVLRWTEDNLSGGDIGARLPAWKWGKRGDQSWGILDNNPASDSDLWIAYALGEAGRLWQDKLLRERAQKLAQRILQEETADIPGLGCTLLPGPMGFVISPTRWRLNPSYTPLHLMHWLAQSQPDPRWKDVLASSLKVIEGASPRGFTADWTLYDAQQGFLVDTDGAEKGQGGYNAIRVYLWAGLLHTATPERQRLLNMLSPMVRYVRTHGHPPESIDIFSTQAERAGPPGFSAALLPFLRASGDATALQSQRQRLATQPVRPAAYYEQTLALFGSGAMDGHYRFHSNGQVRVRW